MGKLQFPDYLLIGAYIVLVFVIGMILKRSIKGAKDYFTAGATMPWWVAGVSYFMASFSTMLFIIYCEIAYTYGLVSFTITWVAGSTMLISGMLMAHRWRRARVMTPMGFMERRYSTSIYQLFVWLGFPLRLLDNGMRIYGIALVTIVAIGGIKVVGVIDANPAWFYLAVFGLGVLFILYSLFGGQSSVMITDFVQAMILLLTVCLITWQCLPRDAVGAVDWSIFSAHVPAKNLDWFQASKTKGYDWLYLTFNIFLISILNNAAGWALVQKYNCVRSEADARKMVWWVVFLKTISPPIFFLPGLAAYYLLTPADIGSNSRYIFALVSFKVLPVGVAGLMMLAMLGSAFSAMGAEYNTLSGVLTRDFYKRVLRKNASSLEEVAFGRMATIGIGIVTMALAIVFNYFRELNLMDLMMRFFGVFGPPVMIPVFVGLLTKKFNSRGVWYGVFMGVIPGIIAVAINLYQVKFIYAEQMKTDPVLDWQLRTLFGAMLSLGVCVLVCAGMYLGSVLHPSTAEEKKIVDEFFENLKTPYLIDRKAKGGISPFKLIGMMATWFGLVMIGVTAVVALGNYSVTSYKLHIIVAVIMCVLGGLMWWRSAQPEPEAAEEEKVLAGVRK